MTISIYKRNKDLGEYYYNDKEHKEVFDGKLKIFSISLCSEKVELWNNKFINISEENMLKNVKSIFILVFS